MSAGALMYLNEATLLNNLRLGYKKGKIYVSIPRMFYGAVLRSGTAEYYLRIHFMCWVDSFHIILWIFM